MDNYGGSMIINKHEMTDLQKKILKLLANGISSKNTAKSLNLTTKEFLEKINELKKHFGTKNIADIISVSRILDII